MKERIERGEVSLAFHGSACRINRFTSGQIGQGRDSNSSLGLCLSHIPLNAMDYAQSSHENGEGDHVLVYVVAYPTAGYSLEMTPDEFFGILVDDSKAPESHFSGLRDDLLSRGFDRAECDTGEDAITVVLNPDRCQIVAVLDPHHIEELECSGIDCMDPLALLEVIKPYTLTPGPIRQRAMDTYEHS